MILDRFELDNTIIRVLDIHMDQVKKEFKKAGYITDLISYTGDINTAFLKKI